MEPLHMRIKKALTEKTQTNEIKKILLIDKNKASPLSTALQQEGYHLIHCDSVQKAWDLIYPHRPHLIVLHLYDFNNGAGLSDLQECQALAEGVPIILAAPARVNQILSKTTQHRAAVVLAPSSTPESVTKMLHHLEASTMKAITALWMRIKRANLRRERKNVERKRSKTYLGEDLQS
jgi:Response regulator containing CheY-like receiver, AAA-type ATPase, and DNA-binding domains